MKVTNIDGWEQAREKFPSFTTEKLEPFKKLNFSGKTVPQQFMQFSQQAMKQITTNTSTITPEERDDVWLQSSNTIVYSGNMM